MNPIIIEEKPLKPPLFLESEDKENTPKMLNNSQFSNLERKGGFEEKKPFSLNSLSSNPYKENTIQSAIDEERPFHDPNEVPVGQKSKFILEEYPENFQIPQEQPKEPVESILPISERLKSKIWKTKQGALDELMKLFSGAIDTKDEIFGQYLEDFQRLAGDSNIGVMEKTLEAFKILCEKSDLSVFGGFKTKDFLKINIEKPYATGKAGLKENVVNLYRFFFVKLDRKLVLESLLECLAHKNHKVTIASIEILLHLLANYGLKPLNFLKEFFPEMDKLAGSNQSQVRSTVLDFYKEAFKWMGENMLLFTSTLKKNIKQELDKFIEEWPKETCMQPLRINELEELGPKDQKKGNAGECDMFDILEGVDIFNKFNDSWCEKVLAQGKWSEKKEMLDELIGAASVPKISGNNSSYPVLAMIKKVLNDNNVNVMVCGVKVLGLLAKGMRKAFNSAAKSFFSILVAKFKDKKTMVIDETQKTLENFLFCLTNIEEVQEDFKDALKDKVLGVKLNVLIWFEKFLEKMIKAQAKSLQSIKTVSPAIKVLLDDGSAEIRDYSTKILGKIKAIYGKEFIPGFFGDIQPAKMQKIEDAEERFRNDRGLTKENSNSVNPTNTHQQKAVLGNNPAKIQIEKPPVNNANKREHPTKPGNNNKQQPIDKKVKVEQSPEETNKPPKLSLEAAEQLLRENSAESLLNGLEATCPWAEKVEALKELPHNHQAKFEDNPNLLEAFLVLLRQRLKDWKESNINIIKQLYTMLTILSESPKPLFSKRILTNIIPLFIERMGEGNKYSELLWGFTVKILAYTNPKFLLNEFLTKFNETINNDIKKANMKTVNEMVGFSIKLIELVSLQSLPFKELIEFGKFLSTSTNPTIKQATVNLMKCLYAYFGQQLNLFLKDLSQTFFKTLQSEFSKVKVLDEKDKKPKIAVVEDGETKGMKKTVDLLDSLPRVDISNEVNKHIKKLSDPDWKVQKEALDEFEKILTVNPRISVENLSAFSDCLKNGLKDKKNKSLLRVYINLVARFAECSGRDFFTFGKVLVPHLLSSLSDKQALVRCDVVNSMHKLEVALGPEFLLTHLVVLLQNPDSRNAQSVEMKQEVLGWLVQNSGVLLKFPNLKSLVPMLLELLVDKNKDIRLMADQLSERIVVGVGPAVFAEQIKYLKSSVAGQIKPMFEKYCLAYREKTTNGTQMTGDKNQKANINQNHENLINEGMNGQVQQTVKLPLLIQIPAVFSNENQTLNNQNSIIVNERLNERVNDSLPRNIENTMRAIQNAPPMLNIQEIQMRFDQQFNGSLSPFARGQPQSKEPHFNSFNPCKIPDSPANFYCSNPPLKLDPTAISQQSFHSNNNDPDQDYIRRNNRNSFANITFEGFGNSSMMHESPSPNVSKRLILQNNLEVLSWSSLPGKIDALFNICNFLSEDSAEYRRVIEEEATNIAKTLNCLFKPDVSLESAGSYSPDEFLNYLVKISLKIFRNKFLLENVTYEVLVELVESILQRLLMEGTNKPENSALKPSESVLGNDSPMKNLNSLMLKILETCNPNTMFQILFDLLIKHRKICGFSKFIGLIIKCILKLTKILDALLPNLDLSKLFLKFHLYVCECFNENLKNNDDLGLKMVKTIINELISIKGASILDYYHIISTHEKPDKYIFRWIESILSRQINVPNVKKSPNEQISMPEEVSKILGKLKNSQNFAEAALEIRNFLINEPNFNLNALGGLMDPGSLERLKSSVENLGLGRNFQDGQ